MNTASNFQQVSLLQAAEGMLTERMRQQADGRFSDESLAQQIALPDEAAVEAAYRSMYRPLRASMSTRVDAGSSMRDLTTRLIDQQPVGGWTEEKLKSFPEWSQEPHGSNHVLYALWNLCRMGSFTFREGRWMQTEFCEKKMGLILESASSGPRAQNMLRQHLAQSRGFLHAWFAEMDTAWETLHSPHCREIFDRLIERIIFSHDAVKSCCEGNGGGGEHCREASLRTIAAASALGAVQNFGGDWQATFYGSWLSVSPDSQLNRMEGSVGSKDS